VGGIHVVAVRQTEAGNARTAAVEGIPVTAGTGDETGHGAGSPLGLDAVLGALVPVKFGVDLVTVVAERLMAELVVHFMAGHAHRFLK
jgi:hypothetical protein